MTVDNVRNTDVLAKMRRAWEVRAAADPLFHIDATRGERSVDDLYTAGEQLVARMVDPQLRAFGLNPEGLRLLEIGCGIGRLFPALGTRFGEVWGVDISSTMIARGRKHCPSAATWILTDGATLAGVKDSTIDYVLSYEVFQHIPEPGPVMSYLAEMRRVLKPGGAFQVQLRRGSDSRQQAVFRVLSPTMKRVSVRLLRTVGYLRVIADVDTWIGCVIDPVDAMTEADRIGFVDVHAVPDEIHAPGMGYWLVGRVPPD